MWPSIMSPSSADKYTLNECDTSSDYQHHEHLPSSSSSFPSTSSSSAASLIRASSSTAPSSFKVLSTDGHHFQPVVTNSSTGSSGSSNSSSSNQHAPDRKPPLTASYSLPLNEHEGSGGRAKSTEKENMPTGTYRRISATKELLSEDIASVQERKMKHRQDEHRKLGKFDCLHTPLQQFSTS